MAAGHVLKVVSIALLVGLLLNADSLHTAAKQQPYGWRRTVATAVMGPVRSITDLVALDRPRDAIEEALGRTEPRREPPAVLSSRVAAAVQAVDVRRPTAAEPLRIWVGGDSMAQVFGESFLRTAVDRGDLDATLDYHISTGLTRPDYFDWPAYLESEVLPSEPEVMVIVFGANDAQPMELDGAVEPVGSPAWVREYRSRVGAVMDQLAGSGRLVVWVGQPVMRDAGFSGRMTILDEIYRAEAASRQWIWFLDTVRLFSAAGGGYSDYLPNAGGEPTRMRQDDGIHLTRAGGDRLARAVLDVIDDETTSEA